jgi:hypothetical protein
VRVWVILWDGSLYMYGSAYLLFLVREVVGQLFGWCGWCGNRRKERLGRGGLDVWSLDGGGELS